MSTYGRHSEKLFRTNLQWIMHLIIFFIPYIGKMLEQPKQAQTVNKLYSSLNQLFLEKSLNSSLN